MISRHSVALTRRSGNRDTARSTHPIKVLEAVSGQSTAAVKAAERLVVAARENVRFLNRHLQKFGEYLGLPSDIDNVLYLAYTIRVRDSAPFTASHLRKHLHGAGIQTASVFSFRTEENFDIVNERIAPPKFTGSDDEQTFCIACHQYLTIPELEHILDTFESFFSGAALPDPAAGSETE